ncbi:MAG: hypothetical protein ABR574_10400 [Cryomorphaceae bacterium]|nr:hypothetical protein [Flavobacteriales bacterium]
MEAKIIIPFRQLIELVRKLNPKQRALLKAELESLPSSNHDNPDFIKVLSDCPDYTDRDIERIHENRKSIERWRSSQ